MSLLDNTNDLPHDAFEGLLRIKFSPDFGESFQVLYYAYLFILQLVGGRQILTSGIKVNGFTHLLIEILDGLCEDFARVLCPVWTCWKLYSRDNLSIGNQADPSGLSLTSSINTFARLW